jgi:hypothetical protein
MSKFKVGDRVVLISNTELENILVYDKEGTKAPIGTKAIINSCLCETDFFSNAKIMILGHILMVNTKQLRLDIKSYRNL